MFCSKSFIVSQDQNLAPQLPLLLAAVICDLSLSVIHRQNIKLKSISD